MTDVVDQDTADEARGSGRSLVSHGGALTLKPAAEPPRGSTPPESFSNAVISLELVDHPDPRVCSTGFPLNHPYVERLWAPTLGPMTVMLLRQVHHLCRATGSAAITAGELARSIGLGPRSGNSSPLRRSMERLVRRGFAERQEAGGLRVYSRVRPLDPAALALVPKFIRPLHDEWSGADPAIHEVSAHVGRLVWRSSAQQCDDSESGRQPYEASRPTAVDVPRSGPPSGAQPFAPRLPPTVSSVLDTIPRLSRRARLEICDRFETVDDLVRTDVIELVALRGIGQHFAIRVIEAARSTML